MHGHRLQTVDHARSANRTPAPLVIVDEARKPVRWAAMMVAAQAGDKAVYARLLREIEPVTRALVRRRIGDASTIDDIVQDTLLTVHRYRATYDPTKPILPWLAAIAHRRCMDHLRRHYRTAAHEVANDGTYDGSVEPEAHAAIAAQDDMRQLDHILADLPRRHRTAIELVKLQELSLVEAAAITRQSVGALKVTVHRALKTLRMKSGDPM